MCLCGINEGVEYYYMGDGVVTHLKTWWRIVVPVAFAVLVVWRFDLRKVAERFAKSDWRLVVTSAVIGFGTMLLLGCWRWWLLLNSYGIRYSLPRVFELYLIGMFTGFFVSDSFGAFARGLYAQEDGHQRL